MRAYGKRTRHVPISILDIRILKDKNLLCYTFICINITQSQHTFYSFQDSVTEKTHCSWQGKVKVQISLSEYMPLPAKPNFQSSQLLTTQHNSSDRIKTMDQQLPWQHRLPNLKLMSKLKKNVLRLALGFILLHVSQLQANMLKHAFV